MKREGEEREKGRKEEGGGSGRGGETSKSVWAAVTKYHRLGGLQTTDIYLSQFWRLEVPDQGASMVGF